MSHETIYLHPRGELKRELISCQRHHTQVRKPRSRGTDRRGQIQDMQSIHIRPPEVEWVFRSIVPTDSGPSRPPIPVYRAQFEGLTGITGHDTGMAGHDTGTVS